MTLTEALDAIITRGIAAARRDYAAGSDKLLGALAGFDACRGKHPDDLWALWQASSRELFAAKERDVRPREAGEKSWRYYVTYHAEVDWVCNCVSVLLVNERIVSPFPRTVGPTARAVIFMSDILGVESGPLP